MSFISLWNKWHIRFPVIFSLFLQVILILCAPLRKKIANHYIVFVLWLAYLGADWIVTYTIGLISHNQVNSSVPIAEVDAALLAFWTSFLLLHLGGPDTITAFSLKDNSLWGRHLLSLGAQVLAAVSVFLQIYLNGDKSLVIPTILVFLAAVLKNVERTLALYLSSLQMLRKTILSQHQNYNDAANSLKKESCDLQSRYPDGLPESIVVKHAYVLFQISKVFLADLIFTYDQRKVSREYFKEVSAVDALRVISAELQFIYEVLHTKALVIRSKWSYFSRFIAFASVVVAFILFNCSKNDRLPKLDVKITYSLLFVAIAIDVIAFFMLVFSDWTVAEIMSGPRSCDCLRTLVSATDSLREPTLAFATDEANPTANVTCDVYRFIFRRWSQSISACNLFAEIFKKSPRKMYEPDQCRCFLLRKIDEILSCFHQAVKKIAATCGLRNTESNIPLIAKMKYMSKNPFAKNLWVFIFDEVKRKSTDASDLAKVKELFEARGDMFLESSPEGINCKKISRSVTKASYDASIITWHLATEICYSIERGFMLPPAITEQREFSKILSDYMLYLLINQPDVMSTVAGIAPMRAGETLRELLDRPHVIFALACRIPMRELCNSFLLDNSFGKYDTIYLNSALRDGTKLARKLFKLDGRKWKVMSGVWVEMLSYAAVHIKGEVHVQVLSEGGELLAFVWLLMAHFGCFYKPKWGIYYESLCHHISPLHPDLLSRYP